jgi:CHAT domain-containing protein
MMKVLVSFFLFLVSTIGFCQSWETCYDSSKFYLNKTYYSRAEYWASKAQLLSSTDKEKTRKSLDLMITIQSELQNSKTVLKYLHQKAALLKPIKAEHNAYFNTLIEISIYDRYINEIEMADSILIVAQLQSKGGIEQNVCNNAKLEVWMEKGRWDNVDALMETQNISDANLYLKKYLHDQDYMFVEEALIKYLSKYKVGSKEHMQMYLQLLPSILKLLQYSDIYEVESPILQIDSVFNYSMQIVSQHYGVNSHPYFEMLITLATEYTDLGNSSKADSLYQSIYVSSVATYGKHNVYAVDALLRLGGIYEQGGELIKALQYYEQLEILAKEVFGKQSAGYADCLLQLFGFQVDLGRKTEAAKNYQSIYPIYLNEYGTKSPEYSSLISINAKLAQQNNDYELATKLLKNAIDVTEKGGVDCNPCYGNMLIALAKIQEQERFYADAEGTYLKALEFLEKNIIDYSTNAYYIDYKTSLADLYVHCKAMNIQDQLLLYRGDTIIHQADGKDHIYSKSKHPRAILEWELQAIYDDAIQYYSSHYSSKHPKVADLRIRKAIYLWIKKENYGASNEFNEGLKSYIEQIRIVFPQMSEKEKTQFYHTLSDHFNTYYAFVLDQPTTKTYVYPSSVSYFKSLMGADSSSYTFTSEDVLSRPMIKIQDHYQGNLFNYRLPTKAMIINNSSNIRQRILNSNDPKLMNTYREWEQQRALMAKYYAGDISVLGKDKIDSLEKALNILERKLSEHSEAFKIEQDENNFSWRSIQNHLKDNEAAVEIIRLHHPLYYQTRKISYTDSIQYAAVIITKACIDNPKVVFLKNGYALENKYLSYYKNSITIKQADAISYNNYWRPIDSELKGKDIIYFSSDGVFNLINLSTLQNELGTYLLDKKDIRLVTNLKDILLLDKNKYIHKDAFILGDPDFQNQDSTKAIESTLNEQRSVEIENLLRGGVANLPGTKIEIETISKTLFKNGWTTEVVQRKSATEAALKNVAGVRLIHLATHGFFISSPDQRTYENPLLRAGLLLAGSTNFNISSQDDGILTAYEAMNLNLENTELVVLSACQTGLGMIQNGEGVYGLQRSFIIAGADAMIMSLWKVDDIATSLLMSSFYNEWMITGNKRQAFIQAQKIVKRAYPDPYYWGAFIYLGE